MTCAVTTPDARHGDRLGGQHHPDTRDCQTRSAPAESIENGPKPDGAQSIILSRASRLRHSNQIQRQRYLAMHQTLSRPSSEAVQ